MDGGATAEERTEPKTKKEKDNTTTDTSDATQFLSDFKTKVLEEERERDCARKSKHNTRYNNGWAKNQNTHQL